MTVIPSDVSVGDFARVTFDHEITDAEHRLAQCEQCHGDGVAVCATPYVQPIEAGLRIVWCDGIERESCDRFAEHELRARLSLFGVPDVFLGASLDRFKLNNSYREEARKYVANFGGSPPYKGKGFHIVGNVGTGKTYFACAIIRDLLVQRKIHNARFVEVPTLMGMLRDTFDMPLQERRAVIRPLTHTDLLVLDDLGAERMTEWVREQLGIIINERWSNSRAMLVTSNFGLDHYGDLLGQRTYSRLRAMLPVVRDFDWKDQR